MDSIKRLLRQVRRKQLLVYAYTPAEAQGVDPTLTELPTVLRCGTAECMALVERLHAKRLIAEIPAAEDGPLRLTPKGERLVRRMGRGEETGQSN